jgi:hypothetical protein
MYVKIKFCVYAWRTCLKTVFFFANHCVLRIAKIYFSQINFILIFISYTPSVWFLYATSIFSPLGEWKKKENREKKNWFISTCYAFFYKLSTVFKNRTLYLYSHHFAPKLSFDFQAIHGKCSVLKFIYNFAHNQSTLNHEIPPHTSDRVVRETFVPIPVYFI